MDSEPHSQEKSAARASTCVAKAAPLSLRQLTQWQCHIGPGRPETAYATARQRQLPRMIVSFSIIGPPCRMPLGAERHASGAANSWSEARAEAIGGRLQQSMIVFEHSSPEKRVHSSPRFLL